MAEDPERRAGGDAAGEKGAGAGEGCAGEENSRREEALEIRRTAGRSMVTLVEYEEFPKWEQGHKGGCSLIRAV